MLPGSEIPPAQWPGWPQGKQFAVVLTHDVEGPLGLERCRPLMEIERELGFRSSFYFIPEGPYRVPLELRQHLKQHGFEVGIHDLHHDGKLYSSYSGFLKRAERINAYLKDWGSVGFRSAFMLHNLDWAHHLNVQYDASTFDTDPFEPQPDGAGTIFPFWVPRNGPKQAAGSSSSPPDSSGYVELPYTLVQDSTLFLLLGEKQPNIWLQKVDWVAKHGGMVLVDTHPDYIAMNGSEPTAWEYPAAHYRQLLNHLRTNYAGAYWHATSVEVADWYRGTLNLASRAATRSGPLVQELSSPVQQGTAAGRSTAEVKHVGRRICMISFSIYDSDNRVMRYAKSLAERGDSVEVFSLKSDPNQASIDTVDGVTVYRIQHRYKDKQKTRSGYLFKILQFWALALIRVSARHLQARYDLVHIHNMPDFLVFAALLPRLGGAKLLLDIHDILPEFYSSKFSSAPQGVGAQVALKCEWASAKFCDHVIISNHLWRDKYMLRTGMSGKCSVFINYVDEKMFRQAPRTRQDDRLIMLFPGGLQWHQGLDIAIRAFQQVSRKLSNAEFHIYGEGNMKSSLISLTQELGLQEKVKFFPLVPLNQVASLVANADVGVVPKRADSFGNEAYSTKIMEFMSLGIPVVASSTKIDRYYFDESVIRFFESGNVDALAKAILEVLENTVLREKLVASGLEYARRNGWNVHRDRYLHLVDSLIEGKPIESAHD